jgi:hypothetical protein
MKLKNIIAFIASVVILGTGVCMGGVEVNGLESASSQSANLKRLKRYVTLEQPRQIKQDINKTIKNFKKNNKGKRYEISAEKYRSNISYIFKRFNVNYSKTSEKDRRIIESAMAGTECYLKHKINGSDYCAGDEEYSNKYYGTSYAIPE